MDIKRCINIKEAREYKKATEHNTYYMKKTFCKQMKKILI